MKKKFILIDGHHLIFRAYHAVAKLKTSFGKDIGGVYGFVSMLFNIIEKEKPEYISIFFDKSKSFRYELDSSYKSNRKETPEDLKGQMEIIFDLVEKLGLKTYEENSFEADDMIGTVSKFNSSNYDDIQSYIITGDMDAMQLIEDGKITVVVPHLGYKEPIYFETKEVFEKYGIYPNQIIDFKAISGDKSDNIKGIDGIGEIGARKLLNEFETFENIYKNLEKISPKIREKLEIGKEKGEKSKKMATIITNIDINGYDKKDCEFFGFKGESISHLENLEFNSLIGRFKKINTIYLNKKNNENDIFSFL